MHVCSYPTDLTDAEWKMLAPLVPLAKPGGRPRKHDERTLLDALFYFVRAGHAWRLLPRYFPPWKTVYHYLRAWRLDGTWEHLLATLCRAARIACGRTPEPSAAVLDSRTVKTSSRGGPRGYDGGKKINGRKHHILVDTMGLPLKVLVLPANVSDRDGGAEVVADARVELPSLRHLFVDGGYRGEWAKWVREVVGWTVDVITRRKIYSRGIWWPNDQPLPDWYFAAVEAEKGFRSLPRRWVVERTFAWLSFQHRLNRDYDLLPETTTACIHIASCRLMLRRLAA